MAEGLVTELINQFLTIVTQEAKQEIRLVVGVKKEIRKLEGNLKTVKAVINDAERRQVKEEAVKVWLEKLNNVCYEMEDVVAEWNTELIKSASQKEEKENADNAPVMKKKQVCSFIPSPSCCFGQVDKLTRRHDIAHKIKELNEILDDITKERVKYGFELTNYPALKVVDDRPQTTSYVDVSDILGRDEAKNELVSILLGKGTEKEKDLHVVSLVGMGGIGKTTLAQLAYNDHEVQDHFEIKVWVCVSNPFNQCKVAKEILESIEHQPPNLTTLQSLLDRICNEVGGKKFLLVFDDVWTEDSTMWDPFRIALQCVAQGSRIIVTTRKSRVAEIMGSASMINLDVLSKEDCWLVFSKIAFFNRDPTQCKQLEGLGRQIVEKCKGLPLAAKTLGSLMRFKRGIEEWRRVLDSNLWELEDEEIKSLYAPLLLSYYDLSSPLRRCFSLCAIFPKDYVFSSDELVFMWMAQGYIESKKNMEIEIIARDYFENLAMRSLFQDFVKDENEGKIKYCKMHDIVHDFAQLISKNECFTINSDIDLGVDYKNARHLHLKILENAKFPESICSAKHLRTLFFVLEGGYILHTLSQHFRFLRVLTLSFEYHGLSKGLLDDVGNFIHLRYLYLVNYNEMELPEIICNLCNLQILHIEFVLRLLKLPQGMDKLINLRHLKLEFGYIGAYNIYFPKGFGRLTSLRTLNYFSAMGEDYSKRCKLDELRNLDHLQGNLEIKGLEKVDQCEATNAQLKKKINLCTLELLFDGFWNPWESTRGIYELVLNALEPPPNLENLSIYFYKGSTMSPWMVSLTNLKNLYFEYLFIEHWPPLGKLPVLESLTIRSFDRLKKLGVEFMGIEESEKKEKNEISITLFPNLISLEFSKFIEWEEWNGIGEEEEEEEVEEEEEEIEEEEEEEDCTRRFTIMPHLQHLRILDCPKLKLLPNFLRTTPLQLLEIQGCQTLEECYKRGTAKEWPKISHIPNIDINSFLKEV